MDQEKSASSFSPSGHGEEKESRKPAKQDGAPLERGGETTRNDPALVSARENGHSAPETLLRTSTCPQWRIEDAESASTSPEEPSHAQRSKRPAKAARKGHMRFSFLRRERKTQPHESAAPGSESTPDCAQHPGQPSAAHDVGQTAGQTAAHTAAQTAAQKASQAAHEAAHLGANIAKGVGRLSQSTFLQGKSWYFLLSVNILLAVVLALTLVWVSIERMDINYFINIERVKLREKQSLHGKLMVEKERLLSPYELRIKAEKLGMKAPRPGQIRRIDMGRARPAKKASR